MDFLMVVTVDDELLDGVEDINYAADYVNKYLPSAFVSVRPVSEVIAS